MRTPEHRATFIQGLRDCADFLDAHPTLDVPYNAQFDIFVENREAAGQVARVASWTKQWSDSWLTLVKDFGGEVVFRVNVERQAVCRKVVTGERVIPAREAQTVETFEWVCEEPSLLAPEKVSA